MAVKIMQAWGDNRLLISYRVVPLRGKLATRWCGCGGHYSAA